MMQMLLGQVRISDGQTNIFMTEEARLPKLVR